MAKVEVSHDHMRLTWRSLGLIGLLGGLGGAINAGLCMLEFRAKTLGGEVILDFGHWTMVPAGFWHGAILTIVSVGFAAVFAQRPRGIRWIGWLLTGWVSGWLSYIAFIGAFTGPLSLAALAWPFESVKKLWQPYRVFGCVALLYYMLLVFWRGLHRRDLRAHLVMAMGSAWVCALVFWIIPGELEVDRPLESIRISLLHGTIWGSLVGFGVWKSQQSPKISS